MSLATTIILVFFIIGGYYVAMIGYDLYSLNAKKDETEGTEEEPIDVSSQLDSFESYDISNQDETANKKKAFVSWMSKGLSPEKMSQLMEDAATGTPNAELKNILFMCDKVAATDPA